MAQNLSNLPIGAKVKFGKYSVNGETAQPIVWLVVAKNHSGYPSNAVTLLTEKVIDLRAFDGLEINNPDSNIASNGNNNYVLSNISRWLNSENLSWYTNAHFYDTPPNNSNTLNNTGYDNRPGFLSNFTSSERNVIINSNLQVATYNKTTESFTAKVFLPSHSELGVNLTSEPIDGSKWTYFNTNNFSAGVTTQCTNYTLGTSKPNELTTSWAYWLRSAVSSTPHNVYQVIGGANVTSIAVKNGSTGVRPAMNLSSTLSISDTTDSDGCYTAVWNSAPLMPTTFNVPTTIYGGKTTTLSWSGVTDPDGNSVTYQLEQSINGGAFTTLYSGTNLSYNTIVPYGTTSVQFRVKATDSVGASSGYNSSVSRTVVNNVAPTISGTNSNLGTKNAEFTQTYTIADSNSNSVTVTEAIDGVRVRSYVATLNATNTFSVTGTTWLTLANGSHTMTITATDGIDSTVRTHTFTKAVSSFSVQTTIPKESSTRPTRIKLSIGREIPVGAIFKVEVCNNGFDTTKTWEDATSSVTGGLVHNFSNTTKVNAKWGVLIKVTVNRNNTSGACYVTSIGGNFE